ncbi:MAG: hypothetical protein WC476_00770 [Phycisphaerae bacterium]|jgi:hypothetical protein
MRKSIARKQGFQKQEIAACTYIVMPDGSTRIIPLQRKTNKGFVDLPVNEVESMKALAKAAYNNTHTLVAA